MLLCVRDMCVVQHALAAARKDNTVLQNFISLLEHRIAELEEREAPAVDYLIGLREQIGEMNEGITTFAFLSCCASACHWRVVYVCVCVCCFVNAQNYTIRISNSAT